MTIITKMKITNPYDKVMVCESLYTFSIYLYLNKNKTSDTLFILGDKVYEQNLFNHIENIIFFKNRKLTEKDKSQIRAKVIPDTFRFLYELSIGKDLYGCDHLPINKVLYKNINIIEDGTLNYVYNKKYHGIKAIFKDILKTRTHDMGFNSSSRKIYLTNLLPIPENLPKKYVNKISLLDRADFISNIRTQLNGYLNANCNSIRDNTTLLITQPLSEDGAITEGEKIRLYWKMVKNKQNLVIKPHPREQTQYKQYFPNAVVLKKNTLVDSLFYNEKINEIITIFSSSILNVKFTHDIKIIQTGTKDFKKLKSRFGIHPCQIIKYEKIGS